MTVIMTEILAPLGADQYRTAGVPRAKIAVTASHQIIPQQTASLDTERYRIRIISCHSLSSCLSPQCLQCYKRLTSHDLTRRSTPRGSDRLYCFSL